MSERSTFQDSIQRKISRIRAGAAPRVVDIFSGCGGLSLGFERAGFKISAGIEIDPYAASSHAVNFHGSRVSRHPDERERHTRDLTILEPHELAAELGFDSDPATAVDVLIGGPPCQSYARVGRAKLREIADHPQAFKVDPRSNLYLRYLYFVSVLQPLVILMENVPDVLNFGGHNIAEEVTASLDSYECTYTMLNSVFYGVPQMRERMFLLAYHKRLEANVAFPAPDHWFELPAGYQSSRSVALRHLKDEELELEHSHYSPPPQPTSDLQKAISAEEALGDLPAITEHLSNRMRGGVRNLNKPVSYSQKKPSRYALEMRSWPKFETQSHGTTTAHVIRSLPRDYKIFRRMKAGDQYPEAHALAHQLFEKYVADIANTRWAVASSSAEYDLLRKKFIPPYDPTKFPNKWRKIEADKPARTVMAHLGKDSYSHIHYDGLQARTISVREAARLQSFPDGFVFVGAMNSAFRQIGNAVPPLLAWKIAQQIIQDCLAPACELDGNAHENPLFDRELLLEPTG